MFKVMIVDDEKIVRDGISYILEHAFKDRLKVVAEARTGREAIELSEEERPHIIFMDIEMPGINGIEALKNIQGQNPHAKCIIVSAYEQFEYAKQAVEIGVKEYLLKPINRKKFIQVVENVINEIEMEKQSKEKELEIQEKLDQVVPILEQGYIYSILLNVDYDKEIAHYNHLLNINEKTGYIMVIEFGEKGEASGMENRIGQGFKQNNYYRSIRSAIKYKCKAIVGPLMLNRIIVLIFDDHTKDDYNMRVNSIILGESLHDKISKMTDSEVYIGIGSCYDKEHISVSYGEAITAIKKITDEHILHIEDTILRGKSQKSYSIEKVKQDEEIILSRIEDGNVKEVEEKLNIFLENIYREYWEEEVVFKRIMLEVIVLINRLTYRHAIDLNDESNLEVYDEIRGMNHYYNIKNWCMNIAIKATENIRLEKENKTSVVITQALKYIEEEYSKELRLNDVAKVVAISPQYFSKIFKEETGVNFIEYVTNLRVEKAKVLINEGKKSIKEICFEIGYHDPNYFSRIFKKVVGKSPSEY